MLGNLLKSVFAGHSGNIFMCHLMDFMYFQIDLF